MCVHPDRGWMSLAGLSHAGLLAAAGWGRCLPGPWQGQADACSGLLSSRCPPCCLRPAGEPFLGCALVHVPEGTGKSGLEVQFPDQCPPRV